MFFIGTCLEQESPNRGFHEISLRHHIPILRLTIRLDIRSNLKVDNLVYLYWYIPLKVKLDCEV